MSGKVSSKASMKGRQIYQRNARHDKRRYEGGQSTSLGSILQTRPAEHVEITSSKHVLRINLTSVWIYKVIVDKHLVPSGDKVGADVEGDL
jgi:hypothetical protein